MKKLPKFTALLLSAGMIASMSLNCYGLEDYSGYDYFADSAYDYSGYDYSGYDYSDPYGIYDESAYYTGDMNAYGYYYTGDGIEIDEENETETAEETAEIVPEEGNSDSLSFPEDWPIAPDTTVGSAYLLDSATGVVLYAKNPSAPVEISGPTKIMTALVALENSNLTDKVVVTATGASAVHSESSNISLAEGETVTVEDCIYGMLLASANDAALQLAEQIGNGSINAFVDMMNAKAEELGCTHTTFTNPTGLPEDDGSIQTTTAHDLALITQAAFQNEDFYRIASASSYTLKGDDFNEERTIYNNLSLKDEDDYFYYDSCIGGREGYTSIANLNIACAAMRDNKLFILVCLDGADTDQDVINLFEYGFSSFKLVNAMDGIEGGTVLLPADANVEDLEVRSSQKLEGSYKNFYYKDLLVGSGFAPYVEEEVVATPTPAPVIDHETNLSEAEELTTGKSQVPYYVIVVLTAAALIALIAVLIKVIKKKE